MDKKLNRFDFQSSSSLAAGAGADLVRLGVHIPQVLVPEHPAVIDGVAVGAVVVTIGRVLPATVVPVLSLVGRKIWTL